MTCKQLGGACNRAFHEAMNEMKQLMTTPDAMKTWFDNKRKEFDALPKVIKKSPGKAGRGALSPPLY